LALLLLIARAVTQYRELQRGEAMNSQVIFAERRKHSRQGIMGELENITYSVLRKHGVNSEAGQKAAVAEPVTQ
jgi:hypothetical protein